MAVKKTLRKPHQSPQVAMMRNRGYVTVPEAAKMLGRHPITVRRMISDGRIQVVRLGRSVYIALAALKAEGGPLMQPSA